MKLSKTKLSNDQPKSLSRSNDKKSVNIKWNSKLFFQLSLIFCLILAYVIIETKFEYVDDYQAINNKDYLEEIPMVNYIIDEPIPIPKKRKIIKEKPLQSIIQKELLILPNNTTEEKMNIIEVPSPIACVFSITSPNKKEETSEPKNIMVVEFVPVFPGCEDLSTNTEKRECMSLKIKKYIVKRFNVDMLENYFDEKEQRISVQFTINEAGEVTNVIAKANNKILENEAKRVVTNLPQMIPGRQGAKNVSVQYTIPITFRTMY